MDKKNDLKIIRGIVVVILLGLAGCASAVNYIPADKESHVVSSNNIEILTETPVKAYNLLGSLEVTGNSRDKIILMLKEKAAELGADALMEVVVEPKKFSAAEKGKGAYASGQLMWDVPKRKIDLFGSLVGRAKVVRYTSQ